MPLNKNIITHFFKLRFTPGKAEQRLQGVTSLLILDLKTFRSEVKGKHSIGREFQSLAVQGKNIFPKKVFLALKSANHFLSRSSVSHRSGSTSETNSNCCHGSES